jgi:hypothetical protein
MRHKTILKFTKNVSLKFTVCELSQAKYKIKPIFIIQRGQKTYNLINV